MTDYWNDEKIVKRFFDKVDKKSEEECWEWTVSKNRGGYGVFGINYKLYRSHRVSFELYNKRLIKEGMLLLHSCDNRKCCNPNHLSEGTSKDNMTDRNNKNHQAKGERNGKSKLTEQQVKEIREKYATGNYTYRQLGIEYSVHKTLIGDIINKKIWTHI